MLADEAARMRRARACRTFAPGRRRAWRTAATVIGQLFLRASDRAERIYDAMRARGWEVPVFTVSTQAPSGRVGVAS